MATDYFVHAAYGVILDDEDITPFLPLLEAALERLSSEADETGFGSSGSCEAADLVAKENPAMFAALCERYSAPPQTCLIHTGDEDDRPGRCHTPAEEWLLAVGILAFPLDGISEEFKKQAGWHTWVTSG